MVVNLQADEPFLGAPELQRVADALARDAELRRGDAGHADYGPRRAVRPARRGGREGPRGPRLYFSRAPIPWIRDGRPASLPRDTPFLRHVGLYAYRVRTLRALVAAEPHPYERAEALEQLRALTAGMHIHVDVVAAPLARGVDTEADLARAEREAGG